jgi:hypothetical protein
MVIHVNKAQLRLVFVPELWFICKFNFDLLASSRPSLIATTKMSSAPRRRKQHSQSGVYFHTNPLQPAADHTFITPSGQQAKVVPLCDPQPTSKKRKLDEDQPVPKASNSIPAPSKPSKPARNQVCPLLLSLLHKY